MVQFVEISEAAAFHVKEMMRHNGEEGSLSACCYKRRRVQRTHIWFRI